MSFVGRILAGSWLGRRRMARALAAWQAGQHGVALDLWAPLAHAGVARAQSNMGAAFLEGKGVERDPVKAVTWLKLAAAQGEVAEERGEDQERNHGDRDRRALAELRAGDAALEGERGHQMGRVHRPAARDGVDQLEVGEGEDDRERHHDRQDRQQQREGDVAEALPRRRTVQQGGLVERRRDGLQAGEERDRDERDAAPDVGGNRRQARQPRVAQEVDVAVDQVRERVLLGLG